MIMRPDEKYGKCWRKSGRPARYGEVKHRGRVRKIILEATHAADDVPLLFYGVYTAQEIFGGAISPAEAATQRS